MKANIAIVSTSINARPPAYEAWSRVGDLYIAGDKNTPDALASFIEEELNGMYWTVSEQDAWTFSEHIGWNCIQRRNVAIMSAFTSKNHDFIVTVDDDNYPLPNAETFVREHVYNMVGTLDSVVGSQTGFLNTGAFVTPQFHQRGVPYGIRTQPVVQRITNQPRVVVSQAQVLGDPDCDAVERMCNAPEILAVTANVVVKPGTYAAFNSQATVWTREWAPVMAVLPGIGRYDDIFASYIFARLGREYNVSLFVGEPCVRQIRNEHNLVNDLRAELWGMNNVFTFCSALDRAHISNDMPLHVAYSELILACEDVLPKQTIDFAREWVAVWREYA